MKNFKQHMGNIHPCLLEYLNKLEKKLDNALSGGNKTTVVLTDTEYLSEEYDILIPSMIREVATGEASSQVDNETTLSVNDLNTIKNAYFLVFRSSSAAIIYYNNNKMWRDTNQMEFDCMNMEVGRKILINPTSRVMIVQRTEV